MSGAKIQRHYRPLGGRKERIWGSKAIPCLEKYCKYKDCFLIDKIREHLLYDSRNYRENNEKCLYV